MLHLTNGLLSGLSEVYLLSATQALWLQGWRALYRSCPLPLGSAGRAMGRRPKLPIMLAHTAATGSGALRTSSGAPLLASLG